jgi:hypothetical protein
MIIVDATAMVAPVIWSLTALVLVCASAILGSALSAGERARQMLHRLLRNGTRRQTGRSLPTGTSRGKSATSPGSPFNAQLHYTPHTIP